jgi:hypothetical protein
MNENELLDLLKDCHGVFDALLAKIISIDPLFLPSRTIYWHVMERLAAVLRESGRLP